MDRASRHPNLGLAAASHVRDRILSGSYRAGERIDQDAIARELGVSRSPVREAVIALEADGLVEVVPRRGTFVARLRPDDVQDHYELFGLLSAMAAERAAVNLVGAGLEQLERTIDRFGRASDPDEQDRLNYEFHRQIHVAGTSRRLRVVLRLLAGSMPRRYFSMNPHWVEVVDEEHRAILAALREHDGPLVVELVEDHFRKVGAEAVRVLRSNGFWSDLDPRQR